MTTNVKACYCKFCDSAVFARVEYDVRTCLCGNVSLNNGKFTTAFKDETTLVENLPVRQTSDILDIDYEEGNDRFGVIRHASKVIPRLLNGVRTELTRRVRLSETNIAI